MTDLNLENKNSTKSSAPIYEEVTAKTAYFPSNHKMATLKNTDMYLV